MKKHIALILCSILFSSVAGAQNLFGVKAGLNVANVTNADASMRLGPHFGAYASLNFTDRFAFQPEILFSIKGYKYTTSSTVPGVDMESKTTATITYLDIPLLANIGITDMFRVHVGPYIGIRGGAKWKTVTTINEKTEKTSGEYTKDMIHGVDLGISAGLGVNLENGINFGLRYSHGFSDVYITRLNEEKNLNSLFQVFLGYGFTI